MNISVSLIFVNLFEARNYVLLMTIEGQCMFCQSVRRDKPQALASGLSERTMLYFTSSMIPSVDIAL